MFGKRVGGFMRRAEQIIAKELDVAPKLRPIFEALVAARPAILEWIRKLAGQVRATARRSRIVRPFITATGIGPVMALAVAAAFDDAARFPRSSSVGAYLGLTPKRYESGEVSHQGHISKRGRSRGDQMRPVGAHGEDEIAPRTAAASAGRAHHFDPSSLRRQRPMPKRQSRREP